MEQRRFQIRVNCQYEGEKNEVKHLEADVMTETGWQRLDLTIQTPGFLTFCYAIMACQHLYLRINASERGLVLQSMTGTLDIVTAPDWIIQQRHIRFDVTLAQGRPTVEDVDYITDRMRYCPSTINLRDIPDATTQVEFN